MRLFRYDKFLSLKSNIQFLLQTVSESFVSFAQKIFVYESSLLCICGNKFSNFAYRHFLLEKSKQ